MFQRSIGRVFLVIGVAAIMAAYGQGRAGQMPGAETLANGNFAQVGDDGSVPGWTLRAGGMGTFKVVKPQDDNASPIMTVTVVNTSSRAWTMELLQQIDKVVERGCTMYISFEYKMSRGFSFQFYWQQETPPWPKLLSLRLTEPTERWQQVRVAVPVQSSFQASQTALSFHLAEKKGVLQIRNMSARLVPADVDPETLETNVIAVLGGDFHDSVWRDEVKERILKLKMSPLNVQVRQGDALVPKARVQIRQTSRPFGVGFECRGALLKPGLLAGKWFAQERKRLQELGDYVPKYRELLFSKDGMFDWVVFSDAFMWRDHESWGSGVSEELLSLASGAGLNVRGHALFCPSYMFAPQACRGLGREALRGAVLSHVKSMCEKYRGKIKYWEVVHGATEYNEIYKFLGVDVLRECFRVAREADPDAKLLLSDVQSLSALSEAPMRDMIELGDWLVNTCGIALDGIVVGAGLKRLDVGPQSMQARLDAISSALSGLPIHVTGLAINTEKETLQAEMLQDYMLLFYSHPAVASVTLGEVWSALLAYPQMGYYRSDLTAMPSLELLQTLLTEEWVTRQEGLTDEAGSFGVTGHVGEYEIVVTSGEKERRFHIALPSLVGRPAEPTVVEGDGNVVRHTQDGTTVEVAF